MIRSAWLVVALAGCDAVFGIGAVGDPPPPAPDANLSIGLVAYYPFDDSVVRDATGHGHDGTCTSCPTLVPGHRGMAAHFDGTMHVDVTMNTLDLGTEGELTIAAFVATDVSNDSCFLNKLVLGSDLDSWQMCIEHGRIGFYTSDATEDLVSPSNLVPADEWHHIAIVLGNVTKSIYLDAMQEGIRNGHTTIDDSPMLIGADRDSGTIVGALIGRLDEVRIYDRALSVDEIAILAAQ